MFCSESSTDRPSFLSSMIEFAICSTITGATPSEGSSSMTSRGLPMSVRATVSICCSPPLIWAPRRSGISARLGKIANSFSGVHDGAGRPSRWVRTAWRPTSRFSMTVRSEKMRRSSGTKPSPRRAISNGLSREMSSPRKRTVPARWGISAISALKVVDLPAPLRPISATTSPRPTWNDGSNRICAAPYHALSPSTSSIASLMQPSCPHRGLWNMGPRLRGDDSHCSWPRLGVGPEGAAGAEIDLLHLRVVADRLGIAVGDQHAARQHDDAVGIGEHHVHRVLGEQHRDPALDHQPLHQRDQLVALARRHAGGGLV